MPAASGSEPFGRRDEGSPLSTRPSTLPTPSQVNPPSAAERNARLIAAPRVPRSPTWQACSRVTRSGVGLVRTTSAAAREARAASPPCPSPSIATIRAPSAMRLTTARSPLVRSPGRSLAAMPHSTRLATAASLLAQAGELVAVAPLAHRDDGAVLGVRRQLELVHEPAGPGDAQAQAASTADVVAQRCVDVADAGSAIDRDHGQSVAMVVLEGLQHDLAASDVHDDVPRDLGDRRGDEGRIGPREPEPLGHRPALGARGHEIGVGLDGDAHLIAHPARLPASGGG